jgi:tetratricopeptide (TPR) repeat protein
MRLLSLVLLAGSLGAPCYAADEPAHPMAPLTLEDISKGALLLDNLGSYHRPLTTPSADAQRFFDQGLRLIWAFNHDEAARSFAKAAELDPACAICFWGVSFALGPNYNMILLPDRAQAAWGAAERAKALREQASPPERALIDAIAKRYKGPEPLDPPAQQPYSEAFAAAMREAAKGFPGDLDVQTLFAESLMDLNPWKLWSLDGKPAPGTEEIVATLEAVLARDPQHPGANHYYIHAVEASQHPEKAVPSAERVGAMMPGGGHLVHMPAHIYQRVGRYAEASEANRKAAAADVAYNAQAKPFGYYPGMYTAHNFGFLAFSAAMEGRSTESVKAARDSVKCVPPEMIAMMPGGDFYVSEPLVALVRFGKWDEILAEPAPGPNMPTLTGLWRFARGMALAGKKRSDDAQAELEALVKIRSEVGPIPAGYNSAADVLGLAAKILEAQVAWSRGKLDDAASLFQDAVAKEDALAYDEPADWFYPVRHHLGAALLAAGRTAEAEAVYLEDLKRNPENGWALFGLTQSLTAQKKTKQAAAAQARFKKAWARADVVLASPAF